jgi:two-component system chemotaxis response regulator CheY
VARILTVDDALLVRRWCAAVLAGAGYESIEAASGDDAVALYREHRPDLVLLDIVLPGRDGLAVLRELRAEDPAARVVMLTRQEQVDVVLEAERLGARDFLVKPCPSDELIATVERALA